MPALRHCKECLRLAAAYEAETMEWFRLEGQLRIAGFSRNLPAAESIARELSAVAQRRTELRAAIDRHKADCHSNGGSPKTRTAASG